MSTKKGAEIEVRNYSLDTNRAGERKLKIKFENIEEKGKGQCLVAQLSLVPFESLSTSIYNFYKDTKGSIKPVKDEKEYM